MSIKLWPLTIALFFILSLSPTLALGNSRSVNISASIGVNRITIFGYTSPQSRVELSSPQVFAVTYSDNDGYFIFDRITITKQFSDICLNSISGAQVRTNPVCLPPPPPTNYHTDIGPILLPPAISLDKSLIQPDSTVAISGFSIPSSIVDIYFYQNTNNAPVFAKPAQAFSLPKISIPVSQDGSFTINLPTSYASNYRLYAATSFLDNSSPKSNTLLYKLPSLWYLYWLEYRYLVIPLGIFLLIIAVVSCLIHLRNHDRRVSTNISK